MKLNLLLYLIFLFPITFFAQQQVMQERIYFETDKFDLTTESEVVLQKMVVSMNDFQNFQIFIKGNTDNVGDSAYNHSLSEKRVEATKAYFISKGIKENVFSTEADGEQKPIADNLTKTGKQQNRRVDITITYVLKTPAFPSIQELYKQLATVPNTFCIDPARDTILTCAKGTIVQLKANSFKIAKSCKDECVKISIREDLTKSDMFLDNLVTMSGKRILETQGMIETVATDCKGKKLNLIKGKEMVIFIPTDTILPNMKIFDGARNPHDNMMNWTVNNNSVLENFTIEQLTYCSDWLCCGSCYSCERCKFFFCRFGRIDNFFKGSVNKGVRAENKLFRKCQRQLRRARRMARRVGQPLPNSTSLFNRPSLEPALRDKCERLEELFKKYNVTNAGDLVNALNKPLMDKFGVNSIGALRDTMAKVNTKNIELAYLNKNISFEDLKYYVYNTTKMGWSNIDAFADIPKNKMVKVDINLRAQSNIDCKIIFIDRSFVIPANVENGNYVFDDLPKGERVWIVAIKYDKGQPFLAMQETVIEKKSYEIEFKSMTLEELKVQLLKLDRK